MVGLHLHLSNPPSRTPIPFVRRSRERSRRVQRAANSPALLSLRIPDRPIRFALSPSAVISSLEWLHLCGPMGGPSLGHPPRNDQLVRFILMWNCHCPLWSLSLGSRGTLTTTNAINLVATAGPVLPSRSLRAPGTQPHPSSLHPSGHRARRAWSRFLPLRAGYPRRRGGWAPRLGHPPDVTLKLAVVLLTLA